VPAQKPKKTPNINLLPEEEFQKSIYGKIVKWALSTGRYIVVFTELIVILAFLSRFKLDRDLTDLHEKIEQKKAIVASAEDLEKQIINVNDTLSKVKTITDQQNPFSSFIKKFTELIPEEISVDSLSINKNEVTLSCVSQTPQGIGNLIYQLNM